MRGTLLLAWAALLAAPRAPLATGAVPGDPARPLNTTEKLNETLSVTTTPSHLLFTTTQGIQSKNDNSLTTDSQGRKYVVQVAPISQWATESDVTYTAISNSYIRARLQPPPLTKAKQQHNIRTELRIQAEKLSNYAFWPFDTYNVTNVIKKNDTLAPKYDYNKYDFSPGTKLTTRDDIEPNVWTDEVWPQSYTNTVQSFTVGSSNTLKSIAEVSDESGWHNETFDDVLSPELSAAVPGSRNAEPQGPGSAEAWSDYSGEESARAERRQFAAALKALVAPGGPAVRAQREHDVDLVLSGERALVQLWPQFGDLLEQLLTLATDTCKNIPLVPLISQYQGPDMPKLKMIAFTAQGRRVLRAGQAMPPVRGPEGMLVVYVPGWWNTPSDHAARALRDALVPLTGELLVLDTRAAFCRPYLTAAARVQRVAEFLAGWVLRSGLPPARLHLLGFSLGAHVVALAALRVRALAGRRLGRVSALEPAAPCLHASGWRRGANHVQVVHTSRSLALRRPLGHADVYAAVRCAPACQHAAAWRLFAASARDPAALTAPRCQAGELAAGACHGRNATLGFRCAPDARGVYLLHPTALTLQETRLIRQKRSYV